MPIRRQSTTRPEAVQTEEGCKKEKKNQAKTKKIIDRKSSISRESGSKTSLKQKIYCYIFCCCCNNGKSTGHKNTNRVR